MKFIIITFLILGFVVFNIVNIDFGQGKTVKHPNAEDLTYQDDLGGGIVDEEPEYTSPIDIDYLRTLEISGSDITTEQELASGSNYEKYIASYQSDGYKIFGLLTVPDTEPPEGGFSAIVFNHGYIPPSQYRTTERYEAYVDYLARNGFVVFKIDLRGNGDSEGISGGTYFSSSYTVDAINALKSLQTLDYVNPEKIGMWGHSMSGNLVLRSMLISDEVKAGVIWAGAVYSYEDFAKYRISDNSYTGRRSQDTRDDRYREESEEVSKLRADPEAIDFNDDFWTRISLTKNIGYLEHPVLLQHAVNDDVVNIGYSRDLSEVLEDNDKVYEFFEYAGGGHNINSPYFEQAMQKTVEFFKENL
jgi:dipeptidyl aminopeptidase/acylaminoacyl peptidase